MQLGLLLLVLLQEMLLLLLLLLELLLLVVMQALADGLAMHVQQLALLGMAAAGAQMVAMKGLLQEYLAVIWAHYLVELMPSC